MDGKKPLWWIGLDAVKDRKTKEPATKYRDTVELKALENGLIVLAAGLSAIRLIPALNITRDQIDMGVEALEKAIVASH